LRIRAATLNVWALPAPLAQQVSARMGAIGDHLSQLDLDAIAFQEVWTPNARDILIAGGRRAGLTHVWHNDASLGGSGLLVLSRLPIEGTRFERYALRGPPEEIAQGDFYGGKGFAEIRLKARDGPLTLINTHLQARYTSQVPHQYHALRAGQIVQLAIHAMDVDGPILAIGDFNLHDQDAGYRILIGLTGLRDAAFEVGRPEPTLLGSNTYRKSRQRPDRRVDYLFQRDGKDIALHARWVKRIFDEPFRLKGKPASYSNHAGVMAEFETTASPLGIHPSPDRSVIALARQLLSQGADEARERQRGGRTWVGAGVGCALLASAGTRRLATTRRRFLRTAIRGTAIAALAPGVGLTVLSEVFVPDELRAFENLAKQLPNVDPRPTDTLA
jgi:endonuclease/exonuclease/phosphatase family metal-dependent hydrolase